MFVHRDGKIHLYASSGQTFGQSRGLFGRFTRRNKDEKLTSSRGQVSDDKGGQTSTVGRATFTCWDSTEAPKHIVALAADDSASAHIHLLNAYSLSIMEADAAYAESLRSGAINLADGTPVVWASKILPGRVNLQQIRGPRLFLETMGVAEQLGISVYFLGSTPDVLRRLEIRFKNEFPALKVAGFESPPYRPLHESELLEQDKRITESGADLIWVGLGTPKQDIESARIHASTGLTTVAVGAAFDFVAGTSREAPRWMHGSGFEWLFRLSQEPARLWRRYTVGSARFLWSVIVNAKDGRA